MRIVILGLLSVSLWAQSQPSGRVLMLGNTDAPVTPTDSPGAGTYSSTQSVTLTDTRAQFILYTTTGTAPSCPATGTLYSGAFNISVTTTLKAIGCNGITGGGVLTSVYTITAGPTFVGSAVSTNLFCSGVTGCPITYSPTAGNTLYVGLVYGSTNVPTSITDNGSSGGSTYTAATTAASVNSGNEFLIWYCTPSAKSGVTTVTINHGSTNGNDSAAIVEVSGAGCTIDQSNTTPNLTTGSANFSSSATSATTNAADVALGLVYNVTTQAPTWTGTNGYTCLAGPGSAFSGNGFTMCYKILSATGAQTATGTASATASMWTNIAVFH